MNNSKRDSDTIRLSEGTRLKMPISFFVSIIVVVSLATGAYLDIKQSILAIHQECTLDFDETIHIDDYEQAEHMRPKNCAVYLPDVLRISRPPAMTKNDPSWRASEKH